MKIIIQMICGSANIICESLAKKLPSCQPPVPILGGTSTERMIEPLDADRVSEPRLEIGQPHLVRPSRRVHLDVVRAPIVLAKNDNARAPVSGIWPNVILVG
jgi:hypothetical protein